MTDYKPTPPANSPTDPIEGGRVRELLQGAGRRPDLPAADLAIIRAAARNEWERLDTDATAPSANSKTRWILPLAASLTLVALVAWWWMGAGSPGPTAIAATVEVLTGKVAVTGSRMEGTTLKVGDALPTGLEIKTLSTGGATDSRIAFQLAGGQSVRLDKSTVLTLASSTRLELAEGAVYVDSGSTANGIVEVVTAYGVVRDIGTQFEVRIGSDEAPVRVRVRQGAVILDSQGSEFSATGGEELTLRQDGSLQRTELDFSGEEWLWVTTLAPAFPIEGQSLRLFLDWVARETGWRIRFSDSELEESASQIVLHGTIDGLTPQQSIAVVIPGSDLTYRLEGRHLLIMRP